MLCLILEGIVGVDVIFVCIGFVLEIFFCYFSVEKVNG